MLHTFLTDNREELILRCREKVVERRNPKVTPAEMEDGIPQFLDQLIRTLQLEESSQPKKGREISGPSGGENSVASEMGQAAKRHGRELMRSGYTINQVVHDYGDLCQAITELAIEEEVGIEVDEYQVFNRCLDNVIADAVTEFSLHRDVSMTAASVTMKPPMKRGTAANNTVDMGDAMRVCVDVAKAAITAIKTGKVGILGATGAVLDKSVIEMSALIDQAFPAAVPGDDKKSSSKPASPRRH